MIQGNKSPIPNREGVSYDQLFPGMKLQYQQEKVDCGCTIESIVGVTAVNDCGVAIEELDFNKQKMERKHLIYKNNWDKEDWIRIYYEELEEG